MKYFRWIVLLLPLVLVAAGEDTNASSEKKEAAAQPAGRLTLPAGAKKIEAFTYRYTDADGKVWIYRQTPFGLVRYEETKDTDEGGSAKEEKKAETGAPPGLKAFDEGDQVRFERQGPFGKYTWRRKKNELNDEERRAFEHAKQEKPTESTTQE